MAGKGFWILLLLVSSTALIRGEDWPEWRGKGRHGVWIESGILDTFPVDGLKVRWRVPIGSGFSGPAVAGGRVFVTDFVRRQGTRGVERVLCLNEGTGAKMWSREWEADYVGLMDTFATGPRATPTVDQARVYVLGATGKLLCLDVGTGGIIWQRDYRQDFRMEVPVWGTTGAPLVDGGKLICLVGGQPNAKVVAFDKTNGKELWRALPSDSEPGYSPPFHVTVGGQRQVIIWHPRAVSSLDPDTGRLLWEIPFKVELSVATPIQSRRYLLVSSFHNGSLLLELDDHRPAAKIVWKGQSQSEINSDGLHAAVTTPAILRDSIYGICSYGQFRCLDLRTGKRIWETLEITGEKARWASGFLVRNGERFFINNDHGELIIAKLSPQGCQQLARTQLIKPTSQPNSRRQGVAAVNWSHPAYANRHIFARNDEEILCASLEKN